MRGALAAAVLLLPGLAFAQETKKFNAKELEKDFAAVGVFAPKGVAIIDNEVVVDTEPERDYRQAVYMVRADIKKVLEFYKVKARVEPTTSGDEDLGTLKYVFAPMPQVDDKRLYRVTVEPASMKGQVMITLMHRRVTSDDIVAGAK